MPHTDARLALIHDWLKQDLGLRADAARAGLERCQLSPLLSRFPRRRRALIVVMDAPPDKEDVRPYLKVSKLLEGIGVHVPHLHETDASRGLLLLEDLGSTHYLARLEAGDDADALYGDALQVAGRYPGAAARRRPRSLRPYDREALVRELALMPEWFCARHLELDLSAEERETLRAAFDFLIAEALAQPQVFVHRDYHSRNLMVLARAQSGRHRFPGRAARARRLRPRLAAEGLLHLLAARARGALGERLPASAARPRAAPCGPATIASSCAGST